MSDEIILEGTPAPRGQAEIRATVGGHLVFIDVLNPADAGARAGFLRAVREHLPGIAGQEAALDRRLMELAGEVEAKRRASEQAEPEKPTGQGRPLEIRDPEPWPEPVNGAELLDDLRALYERHVVLPPHGPGLLALWSLFSWVHDSFQVSPILALTSPEKQCGKTRTLDVLAAVARKPLCTSNISSAALFRVVGLVGPTLLIDEGDAFLEARGEEMRGLLNSGWSRGTALVHRVCEPDLEVRSFTTWAPKAIAAIGDLPDTIQSRSLVLRLERKLPGEHVERLRLKTLQKTTEPIRRRCARWAADHAAELVELEAEVPAEIQNDRLRENIEVLCSIAAVAGGEWPERARRVALALAGAATEHEEGLAVELLADLQKIFGESGAERMATPDLIAKLNNLDDRPWPEWGRGRGLTAHGLARVLRRFGVRPAHWRSSAGATVRGYAVADLTAPIRRYLGNTPDRGVQSGTNGTGPKSLENSDFQSGTKEDSVPIRNWQIPLENRGCATCADSKPPVGPEKTKKVVVIDRTGTGNSVEV